MLFFILFRKVLINKKNFKLNMLRFFIDGQSYKQKLSYQVLVALNLISHYSTKFSFMGPMFSHSFVNFGQIFEP